MKKFYGVLIMGIIALAVLSSQARADDESCCKSMMGGMHEKMMGNMQQMMMGGMKGKVKEKMDLEEKFLHKAHFIMMNAEELGLSDEQAQKLKTLKYNVKKSKIKNDADVELVALDIRQALDNEEVDTGALNTLIDKKYSIKSQAAKDLIASYADLKKLLTKDQMKKMKDIWGSKMKEKGKCMMMEGKQAPGKGMEKDM